MPRKNLDNLYAPNVRGGVELLLTENIATLGKQGQIVRVKSGYARNFLLPQGLATMATEQNKKAVEDHRKRQEEVAVKKVKALKDLAEKVNKYSVSIEANANAEGHLYGSILEPQISQALIKAGYPVQPEHIKLDGPLKETGMYTIKLHFNSEITTDVKVWVIPTSAKM
jgi:large subunit ribosomal protein L9